MRTDRLRHRSPRLSGLALLALLAGPAAAQEPPVCPDPLPAPYVFLLLDTSGSMNYSPICTQTQLDAGECSFLCPSGDCFVPLQADDPASKFWQIKEGFQTFLAGQTNAQLGFATFNQDALRVANKHWLYQAQGAGPTISGWGPYPAAGAQEVFGFNWGCDTGNNDNEIGCVAAKPADLPEAWELTRVQRLPRAGRPSPRPSPSTSVRGRRPAATRPSSCSSTARRPAAPPRPPARPRAIFSTCTVCKPTW